MSLSFWAWGLWCSNSQMTTRMGGLVDQYSSWSLLVQAWTNCYLHIRILESRPLRINEISCFLSLNKSPKKQYFAMWFLWKMRPHSVVFKKDTWFDGSVMAFEYFMRKKATPFQHKWRCGEKGVDSCIKRLFWYFLKYFLF